MRISGSEAFEGGYQIDEGVEIAKQLDGHADIIHVSCGNLFSPGTDFHTHPGIFQQEGMNVKYAAEIKKHVKQSYVATIGGLSDLDVLEEIVASGKADIVEMARGLICDPDLALKAQSGREKEARKCLRCFKCVGQDYQDGRLFCAINPASGKEREAARIPLLCQLLRLGDGSLHALGAFRQHQLGSIGLHQLAPLHAHGLRHGDDRCIPAVLRTRCSVCVFAEERVDCSQKNKDRKERDTAI